MQVDKIHNSAYTNRDMFDQNMHSVRISSILMQS